jgi:hypothetical protein
LLAMHLINPAKTGLSALALKRTLGVSYLMQAMVERETGYVLSGVLGNG